MQRGYPRCISQRNNPPGDEGKLEIQQGCPYASHKSGAETFIAIKSTGSATQLNESYIKFLAKCDFLHRAAHQLALEDEENSAAWTNAQDQLQPMQETIERIYGDAQVQLGIGAPTPETGTVSPGAAKVRICHDLKP